MPVSQKCTAPFCLHKKKVNNCMFATFPRDVNRCREWLKMVGSEDLLHLSIDFLSKSRYVCGCHFTSNDFIKSNKRLTNQAIPSVFDSRVSPLSEDAVMQFPIKNPIILETEAVRMPLSELNSSSKTSKKVEVVNFLPSSENQMDVEQMPIDDSENNSNMAIDIISSSEVSINTTPKRNKLRNSASSATKEMDTRIQLQNQAAIDDSSSSSIRKWNIKERNQNFLKIKLRKMKISRKRNLLFSQKVYKYLDSLKPSVAKYLMFRISRLLSYYSNPANVRNCK